MYVDQEAVQDDEENMKTGANRPPSEGEDVSLFMIFCLKS
jgi:hypothetical protein